MEFLFYKIQCGGYAINDQCHVSCNRTNIDKYYGSYVICLSNEHILEVYPNTEHYYLVYHNPWIDNVDISNLPMII